MLLIFNLIVSTALIRSKISEYLYQPVILDRYNLEQILASPASSETAHLKINGCEKQQTIEIVMQRSKMDTHHTFILYMYIYDGKANINMPYFLQLICQNDQLI